MSNQKDHFNEFGMHSLFRLGVNPAELIRGAGHVLPVPMKSGGGWAIDQSPILGTTITIDRLTKRGYISLVDTYKKVSPLFNEPLYTACPEFASGRPVRTYSGGAYAEASAQACERFSARQSA